MDSYVVGPIEPLLPFSLSEQLRRTAHAFAGKDALISRHQECRFSWAQLDEVVEDWARGLRGLGLADGDRVGVWSTSCWQWVALQLACARARLVLVNVNPAYRSHELRFVLRKSRMKAIFLWERDARANYRQILEEAEAPGESLQVIYFDTFAGWKAFGELPAAEDPHEVVNIQYTSGTTGLPKGVLLTHHNILNNGYLVGRQMNLTADDRICLAVPLYHCFGCVLGVLAAVAHGSALILPSWTFDGGAVLEAIHAERATALYGVPTMFIAELEHADFEQFDLSSLRTGIMSGAPCPIEVMKRVIGQMHAEDITIAYGQTEASPVITMSSCTAPLEVRVSTVGAALPNTEVKIVDPATGETVPVGVQGELCTRGYLVMKGYDDEPEATRKAVDADGWLHTGDLAAMREDGNFRITGRAKDMIIRGGENIYPREIEEFLYTHPAIADVQVIGLPDARLGESVAAWVRLKQGQVLTEEELRSWCRGKVAHFKVPQHIRFVDQFPMTVTGKIQKYRMRQLEIEALDLGKAARIETA
ncbi:MAG: AMP-binding protein [Bryobacterales bacterium]|nr:AMP-binding protein [Bryobacterales bacterium]